MSLINDALNDLEKRNAEPANEDEFVGLEVGARLGIHQEANAASGNQNLVIETVPYSLRSELADLKRTSNTLFVTVFILFLLSVSTAIYLFLDRSNENEQIDLVDASNQPSLVAAKPSEGLNVERDLDGSVIAASEAAASNITAVKTKINAELERITQASKNSSEKNSLALESPLELDKDQGIGSSVVAENNLRLELLLMQADQALLRQRLTTPKNNNAVDLYLAALALDANNQRARQGLENVKATYLKLIDAAYENGRESTVKNLQQRLFGFISESERAHVAETLGATKLKYSALAKQRDIGENSKLVDVKSNGKRGPVDQTNTVMSVTKIEKSSEQLAVDTLANYKQLMVQGRISEAETLLTTVLADNTVSDAIKNSQISPVLFEHYIQVKDVVAAKNWLDDQIASGNAVVFERAKFIDLSESDVAALTFLDSQRLTEPRAMAMYAALLSKFNRFAESASAYRTLLQINKADARYWLGLAVAEDKEGRSNAALHAYQKSQAIGGHQKSVDDFISKRVLVLVRSGEKGNTAGTESEHSQRSLELSQW